MFENCYECGEVLEHKKSNVYGYWGDYRVEFINLPNYTCENCNETYFDKNIAILTQEITRAISDLEYKIKVIDISDCYELLLKNLDRVYDLLIQRELDLIIVSEKGIINKKDVVSLEYNENILMAARNKDKMTEAMKQELQKLLEDIE